MRRIEPGTVPWSAVDAAATRRNVDTDWRFPIMIGASLVEFVAVLRLTLGRETFRDRRVAVVVVSIVVVVLGMVLGKNGNQFGLPWWIYYPVPALITIILPPVVFRTSPRRTLAYVAAALLSAPLIHVVFAFLLGWNEYMPFIPIPSLASLLGG
jgi:hypothetical protein